MTMAGDVNNNFGTANVVGRNSGDASLHIHQAPPSNQPTQPRPAGGNAVGVEVPHDVTRNVFVVHGRDEQVRALMFDFLRRLDLRPLEWEELVAAAGGGTPFLGKVVEIAPFRAQAAVVLMTPDDVVTLHEDLRGPREKYFETRPMCQPRPNVLLELGLALGAYPARTVIVEFGEMRPVSDLEGRNVIRFDGSASALGKIVERLKEAGCPVNDRGADWRTPWPWLAAQERRP